MKNNNGQAANEIHNYDQVTFNIGQPVDEPTKQHAFFVSTGINDCPREVRESLIDLMTNHAFAAKGLQRAWHYRYLIRTSDRQGKPALGASLHVADWLLPVVIMACLVLFGARLALPFFLTDVGPLNGIWFWGYVFGLAGLVSWFERSIFYPRRVAVAANKVINNEKEI